MKLFVKLIFVANFLFLGGGFLIAFFQFIAYNGFGDILLFRLCRSTRKFLSWEPHFSHYLLAKEKHIYDTYLCKYDYCDLLSSDYR